MNGSSPKRRSITHDVSAAATSASTSKSMRSQPTTPIRPSYQSPTKASLARTHPKLFARSPGRSGRGRALREEVLGTVKTREPPNQTVQTVQLESQLEPYSVDSQLSRKIPNSRNSFSEAIANAFAEARPIPSESRSPLRPRQPSANNARAARNGTVESDFGTVIAPKLVTRSSQSRVSDTISSENEPDLPPTPVELGLHPAPEKPRGLSSSSPRSSRHGRRSQGSSIKSSPLKPRNKVPNSQAIASGLTGAAKSTEVVQEALESDVDEENEEVEEAFELETKPLISEEVLQKHKEYTALRAQLTQLNADVHGLETVLELPSKTGSELIDPAVLSLITQAGSESRGPDEEQLILSDPLQLPANPLPHLSLFAPGKLNLQAQTSTRLLKTPKTSNVLQVHTFSLTPPSPWPPHMFGATLEVLVDARQTRIEKVSVLKWRPISTAQHSSLRKWVERRLESDLHSRNPALLVWGIGQYFDACLSRARTWAELDHKWNQTKHRDDDLHLIRYLPQTSMQIEVSGQTQSRKRKRDGDKPSKLLITWDIQLDWTGDTKANIGIDAFSFPSKAKRLIKDAFDSLRRKTGVVPAVEGLLGILQGT